MISDAQARARPLGVWHALVPMYQSAGGTVDDQAHDRTDDGDNDDTVATDASGVLYARTWRLQVDAAPDREAIDMMLDLLLPEVAALPGYRGATMLMDRGSHELCATVYWASLEELEASRTRETNAATGAFVIAAGNRMVTGVHDVVFNVPAPAMANRSLGRD